MRQEFCIGTDEVHSSGSPLSQATRWGNLLFVSGTVPTVSPDGHTVGATIEEQTRQVMENLGHILAAAGSSFDTILKATIFLCDMEDRHAVNGVYREYFSDAYPARSMVEVAALANDYLIEIEVIAEIANP